MTLGVVIVSYKSDALTEKFVREELGKSSVPQRVVVVDNGATQEEAAALEARLHGVKVIAAENGGFAKGNNIGARYLKEHCDPDYILFVNNDVVFGEGDILQELIAKIEEHPEAGLIGPEVVGLDGQRQGPEPYIGPWKKYVFMYLATPFMSLERKRKIFSLDYPGNALEGVHYKLTGCFLLARSCDFFDAGMFDEHTFLYGEENILSDRFASIGKSFYYYPKVRVVHEHGKTISRTIDRKRSILLQFESMSYYYSAYRCYSRFVMRIIGFLFRIILNFTR